MKRKKTQETGLKKHSDTLLDEVRNVKPVRTLQEPHEGDRCKFEQWDGRVTIFSNCRLGQASKYLATY